MWADQADDVQSHSQRLATNVEYILTSYNTTIWRSQTWIEGTKEHHNPASEIQRISERTIINYCIFIYMKFEVVCTYIYR